MPPRKGSRRGRAALPGTLLPEKLGMGARLGQVEAFAPLAAAVLLARDIATAEHSPFTLLAVPYLEVVTIAARANTKRV